MPTEKWKQITIREVRGTYIISESGRITKQGRFSKSTGKWITAKPLKPSKTKKGYLRTILSRDGISKSMYVHRLVALMFIPSVEGKPCVNHKDGNKLNNHYSNLEWCTDAENNEHAKGMGLFYGSNSIIPKDQRRYIQDNFFTVGRVKLAEMFGLTEEYVLAVAKVKVNGTPQRKKHIPLYKEIIDTETGETFTSVQLAVKLNTKPRYICRMLNEERKPNTSQYRYA